MRATGGRAGRGASDIDADFVIIGAGAAGCVLANRLSANPGTRVLLLEAGASDARPEVKIPAAFSKLFHGPQDWNFHTEPDPATANRALYWPRGKMLGGSTSINAMMVVRGNARDYDQWAQAGNRGWAYADVLPYFKRSETFVGDGGDADHHGTDGPMVVASQRSINPLTSAFVAAAESTGLARCNDVNGVGQDGVGFTHVTQLRGRRWSAADAFLRPAMKRPNLRVEMGMTVHRLTLDGRRATGVVYARADGSQRSATAAREIILCAGAIGSPQILQLSGIGPTGTLSACGVPVAMDLPGVGHNLQDHLATGLTYACRQPVSLAGAETLANLARYLLFGRGPLTSNVAEALAFVRTREGLSAPDIELIFAPTYFMAHGAENPPGHGMTIAAILMRPESRGSVVIRSGDPAIAPLIQPNYLTRATDLDTLVAGLGIARRIAEAAPLDAHRGAEVWPGTRASDDVTLRQYIRETSETLYHPVGTCKMGVDTMAVVDPQLCVRGIGCLRVADASIMPTIIAGHTQAPTIMIAEKAADLVRGVA